MYISQEIAERIKSIAAGKNVKLGDMFAEIGISTNTLHNMKTSMPKADTLALIADYLNVPLDKLMDRGIKNNAPEDDLRSAIIEKLNQLSDSQLDRLLGYLEALLSE